MRVYLPILLLILCILCFAGCSSDAPEQTETTGPAEAVVPEGALIGTDGSCPYVIVRPDVRSSTAETDGALTIQKAIHAETGVKLEMTTDFVKAGTEFTEKEFEILVGRTNRAATAEAMSKLVGSRDWCVMRSGSKVVICGTDALADAIAYFKNNYIVDGNVIIPDGELYLHTASYELAALTIGGTPVSDFSIGYTSNGNDLASLAGSIQTWIKTQTGFSLKNGRMEASEQVPAILCTIDPDPKNADRVMVRLDGSRIIVSVGVLVTPTDASERFIMALTEARGGKTAIDTLDATFVCENPRVSVADADTLAGLDAKADGMKKAILEAESEWEVGPDGRIFYFSADGDDKNDGLSEETPKKSLSTVQGLGLKPGDVVLFRRGDMFRGTLNASAGVTYSAYGEGSKPILNASLQNYADPQLWAATRYENVWRLTIRLNNVGIMLFNRTWEYGNYDEIFGHMCVKNVDGFGGTQDLDEELEFYCSYETSDLYLYCAAGNPGEVFDSIEIGSYGNTIKVGSAVGVTVDNLHITMTGSHGVGASNCKKLTVRSCVFDWLGGSILPGYNGANMTRYGNAVEAFGSCDGYYVYNNWIYQIYDTGITHQLSNHPEYKTSTMNDVQYYDNLIEYCYWSIEYYNTVAPGTTRTTQNIDIHDNFCRFGGEGWGCIGREDTAPMVAMNFSGEACINYRLHDNLFDRCTGIMLRYAMDCVEMKNNTFVQYYGENFNQGSTARGNFDITALNELSKYGDSTSKLSFIMEKRGS